ncbi:MAG: hypothetical protein HYW25_00100 [Candidatus Aenigmarchaeota archaeon]|nr:hypothetical protein [Candidatus Aenigmarchaeota archaeon]
MRIKIRKDEDGRTRAVIITFNTSQKNFDSAYERNKFFRELHGWEQTVPSGNKKYHYRRPGLLDEIPHAKIADSVFMIMEEHMKRMEEFFSQWHEKVNWEMHEILMERKNFINMVETNRNQDAIRDERKKMRRIEIE